MEYKLAKIMLITNIYLCSVSVIYHFSVSVEVIINLNNITSSSRKEEPLQQQRPKQHEHELGGRRQEVDGFYDVISGQREAL